MPFTTKLSTACENAEVVSMNESLMQVWPYSGRVQISNDDEFIDLYFDDGDIEIDDDGNADLVDDDGQRHTVQFCMTRPMRKEDLL